MIVCGGVTVSRPGMMWGGISASGWFILGAPYNATGRPRVSKSASECFNPHITAPEDYGVDYFGVYRQNLAKQIRANWAIAVLQTLAVENRLRICGRANVVVAVDNSAATNQGCSNPAFYWSSERVDLLLNSSNRPLPTLLRICAAVVGDVP